MSIEIVELCPVAILTYQTLNDPHARDILLQRGVDQRDSGARAAKRALRMTLPEGGYGNHNGQDSEGEESQADIHNQHRADDAYQRDQRTEHREQTRAEHGLQHIHIAL